MLVKFSVLYRTWQYHQRFLGRFEWLKSVSSIEQRPHSSKMRTNLFTSCGLSILILVCGMKPYFPVIILVFAKPSVKWRTCEGCWVIQFSFTTMNRVCQHDSSGCHASNIATYNECHILGSASEIERKGKRESTGTPLTTRRCHITQSF